MEEAPVLPATALRDQWTAPGDIFSILLILGGDIVQLSIVALAGGAFTPATFSFGWVSYAITALLGAVGENRLVRCAPEIPLVVINLQSGYARANHSWVLARLYNTYQYWMPDEVRAFRTKRDEEEGLLGNNINNASGSTHVETTKRDHRAALCVAVYRWSRNRASGVPKTDWLWWSGLAATAVQLGIAAVPLGISGDWTILLVTAAGNMLAYASASLPQWRQEKWAARRLQGGKSKDVALTEGNGARHVIIVLGEEGSLDLEDLATRSPPDLPSTRVFVSALALLWLALLLTSTGIRANTWYLLAVGGLGMLHNLVVAGAPRQPACIGLPIELASIKTLAAAEGREGQCEETPALFGEEKVMWTLMELEDKFEKHGRSLVGEFFPGKMVKWEEDWWNEGDKVKRRDILTDNKRKQYAKERSRMENKSGMSSSTSKAAASVE
ncbi:hypothetical protein SLS62_010733 [Diatrype stigma]|uniref:Uncharacterized protein n=1 Tax=Diatrype stigma TaxID=117547 RepID=A0AAN9U892_9PEZI